MYKAALMILLAGLAVPAPRERPDDPKLAVENLQGEWLIFRAEFGEPQPKGEQEIKQTRFVFEGKEIHIFGGLADRKEEATFTVDVNQKPYAIDIRPKVGPDVVIQVKGIFQYKDGMLELAFAKPEGERPTTFAAPPGTNAVLLVLRRAGKK